MQLNEQTIILSIGSNLSNPELNVQNAIDEIIRIVHGDYITSDFYRSKSWGYTSNNDFVNAILLIQLHQKITPLNLLNKLKQIEKKMGRKEKTKDFYTDRLIDIDIIFYGNQKIFSTELTLPHPLFLERNFVLIPLMEVLEKCHIPYPNEWLEMRKKNEIFNKQIVDKVDRKF